MTRAVRVVRKKTVKAKKAAKHVPEITWKQLAHEFILSPEDVVTKKLRRKPTQPENTENELVDYLHGLEVKFYRFTRIYRAAGFNREEVGKFYDMLERAFAQKEYPYALTECGMLTKQHFIAKTASTETSPVLLILDGHYSHTRNVKIIDLARMTLVCIILLPSHMTHKLQQLDHTFMGSLKIHSSEHIREWIFTKKGVSNPTTLQRFSERHTSNAQLALLLYPPCSWTKEENIYTRKKGICRNPCDLISIQSRAGDINSKNQGKEDSINSRLWRLSIQLHWKKLV
ncbi:hypothetical protein PR048_033191 [Dryococelus australis]|uniref:DDE-1 domain-containing protein n=1 Tax=Dryococelus australis TaxID=614101 RepID=A0ABQ9FZK2_9NEOP|nr:hypothetical protein PR048_033191 [Dryococelus australis]